MTLRDSWKHGMALAIALALSPAAAWCAKDDGTQGCAEAEKIIQQTDGAKKKAADYGTSVKEREGAKKTWDDAAADEREKIKNKGLANTSLSEAKTAKEKADKAQKDKEDEISKKEGEVNKLVFDAAQTETKPDGSTGPTAAAEKAKAEVDAKKAELEKLKGELPPLKEAATKAKTTQDEKQKAFDAAKDLQEKATKLSAETKTAYDGKQKAEDTAAKDRVKAAQRLLEQHHKIGKTAMRCSKYQLTGAGAALWQTWKTGTKTLTAAMDKQMDLFAKTGTQTRADRTKDALALGGFEAGTAKAKTFEKNITDRIAETTSKRDEDLAKANQVAAENQRELERQAAVKKKADEITAQEAVVKAAEDEYNNCAWLKRLICTKSALKAKLDQENAKLAQMRGTAS